MDTLYLPSSDVSVQSSLTKLQTEPSQSSDISAGHLGISDSRLYTIIHGMSKTTPGDKDHHSPASSTTSYIHKETGVLKRFMGFPKEEEIVEQPSTSSDFETTPTPVDEPVGCLAFHIKHCKDFTNTLVLKKNMQLMIRITVGDVMKSTEPLYIRKIIKMKKSRVLIPFEEVKYFIAQIPKRRNDERNIIAVELLGFEQSIEAQRLLGQSHLHLIDIVKQGSVTETFELGIKNLHVCYLDMSIDFSYGYFGYGHSNQLKQVEKEKTSINDSSLFLRIPPLETRKDEANNVITYQTMPYPAFLPKELHVSVGSLAKERERETAVVDSSEYFTKVPRSVLQLMKARKRLEALRHEYNAKKSHEQRIEFLEQLILRKMGKPGRILKPERRPKTSFSPEVPTAFSNEDYQPEGLSPAVENEETSSGPCDEAKTSKIYRRPVLSTQKAEIQTTSSGTKTKLSASESQPSTSAIVSINNLQNPFLKFLQWMHRIFQRIMPRNPDNVTSVKLEAKSDVPEPEPERPQSLSATEHTTVDVSNQCSSTLFLSPEITIQEDKQDDKVLEQTKPGPFPSNFMSRSAPAQIPPPEVNQKAKKGLKVKDNENKIQLSDDFTSRSAPGQLHIPVKHTPPRTVTLHEIKRTLQKQHSYAENMSSQEIIGGLLSTSLPKHVPLVFTSSDIGSHDSSKLIVSEDQRDPENASSMRFSTNPSISVHSSNGNEQKHVMVEDITDSQTTNPSAESTEASGESSPREGYKKYSRKKQDSPKSPIPLSTNILDDPPKKHQIYLIDTLIPETWRDLAAESELAFREQSSLLNNKAQQLTGGQYAVHSPKYESSDIDTEQDESRLSARGFPSIQTDGRKSFFSSKTFESSEGSSERGPDQAEDIPYPAASPSDQEKTDPSLDVPKEDLQAGQVKASFSATGKDTTISTVFVDQILLGDDTKVKTKPLEVGHQDSYQWTEASSRRDSETEEQQKGPSTSSGKEARVDVTARTPRVADALPLDSPRIETISGESDRMQSDPQGEEQPARHGSIDSIRISPASSSFMIRQTYSEPAISKLASDHEEIRKLCKTQTRPEEDQDQENNSQKGGITLKDSKLMQNYAGRHLMVDPSMSGSSIESNVSSQHSTMTAISKSPSGGVIEPAGRHTVNLTDHKPSLTSVGDQDTSAAQGETTQNSISVSGREATELTKAEATSEEVIGQPSSQQEEHPALDIEESGQAATKQRNSVKPEKALNTRCAERNKTNRASN